MNKRILTLLLTIFILTGLAFSAVPFLSSFNPTEAAKDKEKLKVDITKIKLNSVKEYEWHGYAVFVIKNETELKAFLMPFEQGIYLLPDPTWVRALVPCKVFQASKPNRTPTLIYY